MSPHTRTVFTTWLAALALGLMFALALGSIGDESPTFDEQGFLVRGLAYLRGEANGGTRVIRVGHPLGLNALNAALLVDDSTVRLPFDDRSLGGTDFHRPAERFLWEIGNDVAHVMFLARLPTIWLGLLLAAIVGRWAREVLAGWGPRPAAGAGGLVALMLVAFDPNVLAHTRLVTTDLGLAAGAALAGYTLWRFLKRPSWSRAAVAGVGLGLLQNTKFTALLFLPLFAVVVLLALWQRRRDRRELMRSVLLVALVYPAVALLVLWATNGFQTGPLQSPLPFLGTLGGASIPLSLHFDQLLDIGGRLQTGAPAFLLGQYSDSGWWYYFPVALALKTPLPSLLLVAAALIRIVITFRDPLARRERGFDVAALLIPALGYFAIALTTDINLGYRHLLALLPFLYVLAGAVVGEALGVAGDRRPRQARGWQMLAVGTLSWLFVATLWIYPSFLSFFNAFAGGPDNGWRALVDSNIDWGQDLGRLRAWQDANGGQRVWLSYFGEGRPEYYGIAYDGLDSFPPRLMNSNARPFYPADPAPGWYAISATTLQGVHFANHDQFRVFRERPPEDKVGYSIFLYRQPARGEPVDLLLSNIQLDDLLPEDYARLGTNDVRPRWFDGAQAVIVPDGARAAWLAAPPGESLHAQLRTYLEDGADSEHERGSNTLTPVTPRPPSGRGESLALDSGEVFFTGAPVVTVVDGRVTVLTTWRQGGEPRPIKVYVHVLDEQGEIVAQWDGLGAAWEGWRAGDTLAQVQEIELPADLVRGTYRIVTGLYDPETNQRWRFAGGADGVQLGEFTIP